MMLRGQELRNYFFNCNNHPVSIKGKNAKVKFPALKILKGIFHFEISLRFTKV